MLKIHLFDFFRQRTFLDCCGDFHDLAAADSEKSAFLVLFAVQYDCLVAEFGFHCLHSVFHIACLKNFYLQTESPPIPFDAEIISEKISLAKKKSTTNQRRKVQFLQKLIGLQDAFLILQSK